jgi:PAS domain-containing protein
MMLRDLTSVPAANDPAANGTIVALARYRQSLLRRAAELVSAADFVAQAEQCAPLPQVSALLASSLEALQAAEEELLRQNQSLASARSELEQRVSYFQRLFDLAPAPLILTDPFGSVILANSAALRLLKVLDAYRLVDKPLASLVPLSHRAKFRRELSRVMGAERVVDWRLTVARRADTPIDVTVAVEIVNELGRDGGNALLWCLRPMVIDPIDALASRNAATARITPSPMVDRAD